MPTPIIILFILTVLSIIVTAYIDNSKYNKYSYIAKTVFMVLLITMSLVGFLVSYEGIGENHILYGILMMILIILYSIRNLVLLYINKFKEIDVNKLRYIEIYSSMAFYLLSFIVMVIYLSYSFISVIIACIYAIVFYTSIYLLKRKETKETVLLFFIYALIISLFASLPLTALFSISDSSTRINIAAFLTVASSLIFLSSIFKYGDVIFNTYPKNIKLSNAFTFIFYSLGLTFMSLSITYIFLWSW